MWISRSRYDPRWLCRDSGERSGGGKRRLQRAYLCPGRPRMGNFSRRVFLSSAEGVDGAPPTYAGCLRVHDGEGGVHGSSEGRDYGRLLIAERRGHLSALHFVSPPLHSYARRVGGGVLVVTSSLFGLGWDFARNDVIVMDNLFLFHFIVFHPHHLPTTTSISVNTIISITVIVTITTIITMLNRIPSYSANLLDCTFALKCVSRTQRGGECCVT